MAEIRERDWYELAYPNMFPPCRLNDDSMAVFMQEYEQTYAWMYRWDMIGYELDYSDDVAKFNAGEYNPQVLKQFVEQRGDIIASDREAAAFIVACRKIVQRYSRFHNHRIQLMGELGPEEDDTTCYIGPCVQATWGDNGWELQLRQTPSTESTIAFDWGHGIPCTVLFKVPKTPDKPTCLMVSVNTMPDGFTTRVGFTFEIDAKYVSKEWDLSQ